MAWNKQADGSHRNGAAKYADLGLYLAKAIHDDEWEVRTDADGLITTADHLADAKSQARDYADGTL